MTPEETKSLLDNIVAELNQAADFAGALDPAIIPFIVIGKAVSKQIPGLVSSVQNWVEGNPPTEAEKKELLAKLAVLGNPDLP